jgi:hypothetical protein
MFTIDFLEQQLRATPFVPFSIVLYSGDRFHIKTADYVGLPPRAEDTSQRGPEFIAYTEHGVPRYLVVSNIATIEHAD